jgi:diguanylate cyclase (GGDEF)-like protein
LLDVPIVIASLVDTDRIWFKSHHGLDITEINRAPGLCASAVLSDEFYMLTDARIDPRSLTNPLVAGEFGLRFYAAAPLQTYDHFNLGTLCCLDFVPRSFDDKQQKILQCMAQLIMDQMELRLSARRVDALHQDLRELNEKLHIQASVDSLTKIWNRGAIIKMLKQALKRFQQVHEPLSVMILDIDFFKEINDTYGHQRGDVVLKTVVQRIHHALRDGDAIGRIGGEEFLCIMQPCTRLHAKKIAERCRQNVSATPISIGKRQGANHKIKVKMTVSGGICCLEKPADIEMFEILTKADEALYRAKQKGRNCIEMSE